MAQTRLDKNHWHDFDREREELLKLHGKSQIVLYAPTFSPSLTSLPALKEALLHLVKMRDVVLLLKLHPLTKKSGWMNINNWQNKKNTLYGKTALMLRSIS